jgi:hypothetical protein
MPTTYQYSEVRFKPRQVSQRSGYKKGRVKKCAGNTPANAFLNHSFAPIIGRYLDGLGQAAQIEKEFFASLSNLDDFFGLGLPSYKELGYPMNIIEAFKQADRTIKQKQKGLHLIILNDSKHKACIANVKNYDTGMCLYYIPIQPLQLLLKQPDKRAKANLLLSVFAYLYQVAKMPYHNEGYLEATYDMIYNWYEEDAEACDEEDYYAIKQAYRAMNYYSSKIFKSIRHPYTLEQFAYRVERYSVKSANDKELHEVSKQLLALYRQHPNRGIFDNIHHALIEPAVEERITPDEYISFFWQADGIIYQQLMETVNLDFQEKCVIDEPAYIQYFDQPQKKVQCEFGFEETFFECLHQLSDVLNEL